MTKLQKQVRVKRRKRIGSEAREEALVAGRALLLERGPSAVTLANVGKRIGMSHTNVIHHFGSAADLQSALMGSMILDLTSALDQIVAQIRSDEAAPQQVIDRVFDAFEKGGAGHLAAWIALSRDNEHLQPISDAVHSLVAAFAERLPGFEAEIRSAVLLIAICAFGDAVIGPDIRGMLAEPNDAMRTITVRALQASLVPAPPVS